MTVLSEGPLCLKIHLSKYELKKYFNEYNEINIKDYNTRKTIIMLFNIAVNVSEFETNGKRIIEIFPTQFGGCILKFTTEPEIQNARNPKLKILKSQNTPYIFCFKDFENLLTATIKLSKDKKALNYKSSLYIANNKYFFIINLPLFDIKTGIFINEFCDYSTKGIFAESKLLEYSKEIIKNTAIQTLSKYFFKEGS